MASAPNVLQLFGPPSQKAYRAATSRDLREIRAKERLTNADLADALGCSHQTIVNALAEENDLNAVTVLRLAFVFGEEAISNIRSLYLCAAREPESISEKRRRLINELAALEDEQ